MTKKTQDEIQLNLKQFLDRGKNLIDYFIVIGSNPGIFLNSWLYESDISTLNNNYNEEIYPQIISKFPPYEKKIIGIDESLIQHCFPNGFFIEEFSKNPQPEIFSILLDNNNYSLEYSFKYVVCIKFYESISNYKKLYDKYNIMKNENSDKKSENKTQRNDTISVYSKFSDSNNPKIKYKKFYIPKCICLISLYPFINEMMKIGKNIYKYSTTPKLQIPIEKIISNLVIEVPSPPRGIYSIEYNLLNEKIIFKQNLINQLPTLNIDFGKLFSLFLISQVLEIFKHLMLNNRVIFFSSDIKLLSPIILSSLILLYPFKFPYNVVSVLPKDAYNLLDNITSFVVGINEKYRDNFLKEYDIDITKDTFLIVDIDNKKLKIINDKNTPDLPLKYKKILIEKFTAYNNSIHYNAKYKIQESLDNFSNNIRELFYEFQISIMKNYYKFLNDQIYSHQDSTKHPFESAFKVKEFLNSVSNENLNFYTKFIQTQMFCDFIFKRMTPNEKSEKLDILLFEEKIFQRQKKKDLKINPILLSSNDYKIVKKYAVPKPSNLTEEQIEFFSNNENKLKLLSDGIDISSPPFQKNLLNFTYFIFPKLQDLYFFNTDCKNYFLFPNFSEVENINSYVIAKSHLNSVQIKNDMEDYIYLLWLKLWVFSFWYHDTQEIEYRFVQMIDVLNQVTNHEMELINYLFKVLVENNVNDNLILKLYENIIKLRITPTQYIFDIIKKIISKIEKNNNNNNNNPNIKLINNRFNIMKYLKNIQINFKKGNQTYFRKRTIKTKFDVNIIKPNIKFYTEQICQECNKKLNLYQLLQNSNEEKEILWAKCPYDNSYFLPELIVRFGNEMNKNSNLKISTSILDNIALYSPYTLYYTMLNSIIKDNKLDINNFKCNFNPIFWNLIWYFSVEKLPFDFILPYENEICFYGNEFKNISQGNIFQINFKKYNDIMKPNPHLISITKKRKKFNKLEISNEIDFEIERTSQKLTDENKSLYSTIQDSNHNHNIILTGESLLNINNLVDTSSIFNDNINESMDIKKSNYTHSSRYLRKINYKTKLGEIKEEYDQKEINKTPNKDIRENESPSPIPIMISPNSPLNLRPNSTLKGKIRHTENSFEENEEQKITPFQNNEI